MCLADRLLPKLDFLTVVAVRDLTISYSIVLEGGDTAVSCPVPAAVVQHDMQLLVAPDQSGLYIEMAGQLARCAFVCVCGLEWDWVGSRVASRFGGLALS